MKSIANFTFPLLLPAFVSLAFSGKVMAPHTSEHILNNSNAYYFVVPTLPVSQCSNGEIMAIPKGPQIQQARLAAGELPDGIVLYPNGFLAVNQEELLQDGDYQFVIETYDAHHEVKRHALSLQLTARERNDRDASFAVRKQKDGGQYNQDEVLAAVQDPDGSIKEAIHIRGAFPKGARLQPDGQLVVEDVENLQSGTFNFWIASADEYQGVTLLAVTLKIAARELAQEVLPE